MSRLLRASLVALLGSACAAGHVPPAEQGRSESGVPVVATASAGRMDALATVAPPPPSKSPEACRVMTVNERCRAGAPQRPVRGASREGLFSTNGKTIFYYQQKTDFDLRTLRYATVLDCPLWENVAAWDRRDVYVLEPQSCGGENCGGDYTGFSWGGLGVRDPAAFHWLPGGYGVDKRFVYNRWHNGPLDGAHPEHFEVLLCGGDEGFVVGRDGGRLFRDGKLVPEAQAFNSAPDSP